MAADDEAPENASDAAAELRRLLHALLLATDRPLDPAAVVEMIAGAVDEEEWPALADRAEVDAALAALRGGPLDGQGGVELVQVAGGWRLRTAPDLAPMVRRLWPDKQVRLSRAALEALSVIAYRQPCTRPDIEEVRGVDCGGVLRSLLDRRLIRVVGRKDEPGRPLLYGTTSAFLELFSLPDLRSMPTLRDLEDMRLEEVARQHGLQPGSDDDLPPDDEDAAPDDGREPGEGEEGDPLAPGAAPAPEDPQTPVDEEE